MRPGDALPSRWPVTWSAEPARMARIEAMQRHLSREATRLFAWHIATLLQLWVSELEPEICTSREGEFLGLGYGGRIIVPVSWTAHLAPMRGC